jgi:hypothetical protein
MCTEKSVLPLPAIDLMVYTGSGLIGRSGTLGEFAISYNGGVLNR